MVEVGVGEQALLLPHGLVDSFGNRVQHLVTHFVGELFRPALDHLVARVGLFVDGVAKAHDLVLAFQHAQQLGSGLLRALETLDQLHRRLVGTAMQRATQRTDGSGYTGVQVGQGRGTDAGGEGRGVELVLGVEDQRHVHDLDVQLARLLAVQQVQEVATEGVFVTAAVDTHAVVGEAVPVAHHRREQRQQAIGLVTLGIEGQFGFQGTQHRTTRAHHVHRVGVTRDALEHFLQGLRQVTQALELALVVGQFGFAWQLAVQQQVSDFLELGTRRQVTHIVTTIGQPGTGLAHGRQCGLAGHLAAQACATEYFCFGHGVSPFLNLLWILSG